MFDRFSDDARSVMGLARENALRLRHDFIGPEHVLLALAEDKEGKGARVLQGFDVDLTKLRNAVESNLETGEGTESPQTLPFTDAAKRVLEQTVDEVKRLGHHHVGSEHVLLGLLREPSGVVATALHDAGVDLEAARIRIASRRT